MVGRQQAHAGGDDAVAVVVGVAGKGNVVLVFQRNQRGHGVFARRVHADTAIPVQRHEAEGGVHLLAHHAEIQRIFFGNPGPVVHTCAAQRVNPHADTRAADQVHVNHIGQVGYVRGDVVMAVGGVGAQRLGVGHALHVPEAGFQMHIGGFFNPAGNVAVGRTAVSGVVFVAAVFGRVVRRGHQNAIGQPRGTALVVDQDGVGYGGRGGVFIAFGQHHMHAVGGQYLQRGSTCGLGQCVGIDTQKHRTGNVVQRAVLANSLGNGQHVLFVKAAVEGTAPVARGTKRHALGTLRRVGLQAVVSGAQAWQIDQHGKRCSVTG